MDNMTKQDIAARMAKAAIELDRLEKEKKETVREYNEQINDVQDQIISLARQYEDNTPTLFDVTYDFAPAGDVEDAKEVRLLPAGEPEGEEEPEATYDPTYEVEDAEESDPDELPFPEVEEPQELKYIPSEEQLAIPENPKIRPLTENDFTLHNEVSDRKRKRRVKRGAL